jgi:hypothetical protein
VYINEPFHSSSCNQGGKLKSNVSTTNHYDELSLTIRCSLLGGLLMIIVGGLYLLFEDSIINQLHFSKEKEIQNDQPFISRAVVGIQVGMACSRLIHTANLL